MQPFVPAGITSPTSCHSGTFLPPSHAPAHKTCLCALQAAQGALRRAILQQYLQLKLDTCGCYAEEASVLFDDERVFSTRHMQQVRHHQRLVTL